MIWLIVRLLPLRLLAVALMVIVAAAAAGITAPFDPLLDAVPEFDLGLELGWRNLI